MELITEFFAYKYFPAALLSLIIIYIYNSYNVETKIDISRLENELELDQSIMEKIRKMIKSGMLVDDYYYLRPSYLDTPSFITLLIILILTLYSISNYIFILSNWDSEKCHDGNFYVAPLYYKDTKQTIKECTEPMIKESVNNHLKNINNRVSTTENEVNNMKNNMGNLENEAAGFDETTTSKLATATNSLRESVEYAKNSLSTILGALFINSNMNNETLNTVKEIDKTTISNIINDFDEIEYPQ
tara:strand:- start:208 stop:942 length:735 start_codon:yes stop_codon:yes gene_type:complete